MADARVQRYLYITGPEVCSQTVNTAIVDIASEDYVATLTPTEREDAEMEVNLMAASTDWPDWARRLLLVGYLRELRQQRRDLEARVAALEAALTQ